ncbi:hypothetical protein ICN48_03715 [Polynucleobacter sp. JS-Safj-400b-B2]|nr:hypothetical protein [Polynucleobacter sp. JS-Safj-400b-B2]
MAANICLSPDAIRELKTAGDRWQARVSATLRHISNERPIAG